jgi:uncharacterized protein (TIGR02246 family)
VDVSTVKDETAIRRLIADYCHFYDDRRPDAFADLFADDATFTVFGTRRDGRQAIHDHIGTQKEGQAPGQHVTYNCVVDVASDGASARAWTDFMYLTRTDSGFAITTAGRYHDRLVREFDHWLFQRRTMVFLGDEVPEDA